ncbi:MAG: methyltransferase domain-containing protein [Fidelibacterota bacterium]
MAAVAYTTWETLEQVQRYAAKRYRSWDQRWLDGKERKLVRGLFQKHHMSGPILDVPVGYGRFLPLLQEFGPVYAADAGFLPLVYQRERIGLSRGSVNGAAERLPFKDRCVQVVFCFRLLQHMHRAAERVAILQQLRRVSRKWVIVSVYLNSSFHRLQRNLFRKPSRITMVERGQFERDVSQADLAVVEDVPVLRGLHAHHIYLLSTKQSP